MRKRTVILLVGALILFITSKTLAQTDYQVHSHNDYLQELPFWYAYSNGASSIEADIFLKNDSLFVAHSEDEIVPGRTLEKLYLDRLGSLGQSGELRTLQLLIDLKSEAYATLERLEAVLRKYPNLIDNSGVKFVISGNRPLAKDYRNYPEFIWFDHQNLKELNKIELTKVALISSSFKSYTVWNGYGRMTAPDLEKVTRAIQMAKAAGKPFRFWATPDTKTAWARLAELGVDFINTDQPALAKQYLDQLNQSTFTLEAPKAVYEPTYGHDADKVPTNIILMVGDGNGLAQISSAMIANRGRLTLTGLKDIGLVKTASADDLITDSAAGATAMGTGFKTNNRAIGTAPHGKALPNLVEVLDGKGFHTAMVTTDAIYGATPSAFYAHRVERDNTEGIVQDLLSSPLDLFIAGGKNQEETISSAFVTKTLNDLGNLENPTAVSLGANKVPSMLDGREELFPTAVRQALNALDAKDAPFFLMVEGAQIDNGGHSNSTKAIINEMLDFDQAIAEALKFADRHGNTLVIITADHETSGFGIMGGNLEEGRVQGGFLTVDHTGIMVPLFAYGPRAGMFNGVYENTELFYHILEALNSMHSPK